MAEPVKIEVRGFTGRSGSNLGAGAGAAAGGPAFGNGPMRIGA